MTESTISTPVPLPLLRTFLLLPADTMTDSLGFVPSYFSEDSQYESSPGRATVYSIRGAYQTDGAVVYQWQDLRPLSAGPSETVYSVAYNGIEDAYRRIVEELIESGSFDALGVGAEIVVPVHPSNLDPGFLCVRKAILLLPRDPSSD